jgi:hypothetical protein
MKLRPSTNLIVPQHLALPRAQLKTGFFHVYGAHYAGSPVMYMTKLWASLFFPSLTLNPKFGQSRNRAKIGDALRRLTRPSYLKVKIERQFKDPHIIASVPVFSCSANNAGGAFSFLYDHFVRPPRTNDAYMPTAEQEAEIQGLRAYFTDESQEAQEIVFSPLQVLHSLRHLTQNEQGMLRQSLQSVRIVRKKGLAVFFVDFKITRAEAQQLTTTEWHQLREIDIYPLLLQWTMTSFGEREPAPLASFPISKIALSLPASHVESARVSEHGLSIGPNGKPYYLPRSIDRQHTVQYEDAYTQAGMRPDGSYALTDIHEGAEAHAAGTEIKVKLPKSVPVLIDWVNNKYSYTDTNGLLHVMDLMRFRKAEIPHVRILLAEHYITEERLELFLKLGKAAGVKDMEFMPTNDDLERAPYTIRHELMRAATPKRWFDVALLGWQIDKDREDLPFREVSATAYPPFRPLAEFLKLICKEVLANLAAVYREYSVRTVMENLSWLVMMAEYNERFDQIQAEDLLIRKPAIEQGVLPDWSLPECPLINRSLDIGLIPHQVKVRNLLRESPLFALIPVQAGGGKTLLLLTDILYEIQRGNPGPFLIMCPGHLVSNYVNEVLYFTGGRMNVMPVTSAVIREHGVERLQEMMEALPINSLVVVDYDTLKYRQQTICYGTTPVALYPVIDFLRQFSFAYAGLDESHRVKRDTARTKAAMCLITDIPKLRLASGTMAHDSPSDIAMQVASMDPTLFGTREEFNRKYGSYVSGGRVMHWREGAQEQIRHKINSRIVVAGAMRKEWAAFLPTKREWIGGVELKTNQQLVYDSILEETLEKIQEDAKENKELAKFLKPQTSIVPSQNDPEADDDDPLDEDAGSDLASLLRPYLARLERFLLAPGKDELGAKLLEGNDLVSPKAKAVIERLKLHMFGGKVRDSEGVEQEVGPTPGKVLIFTNYIISAEAIWELAGPELQKCGILYKAEDKSECVARFEKLDSLQWMVGVEQSMNEGLNFQFVSRTIRPEAVWNPGTLEQGNSRTGRPQLKTVDQRTSVYYDSLVINRTIDITKTARLISKIISVAKFENSENPEFSTIPDVPIIKMSLDAIQMFNTWEYIDDAHPGLASYAAALSKYEQVRNRDYEAYLSKYVSKYGNRPVRTAIPIADDPEGSAFMGSLPYVPGSDIPMKERIRAVRVDDYLNQIEEELSDSDEEESEGSLQRKIEYLKTRRVHTSFGEGQVRRCGPNSKHVLVQLDSDYSVAVRKSACFMLQGKTQESVREVLAERLRLDFKKVRAVPASLFKESRQKSKARILREQRIAARAERVRIRERRKALSIKLSLVMSNGFFGLSYAADDNQKAMQTLQANGFRSSAAFYFAKLGSGKALARQLNRWEENGLQPDRKHLKEGSAQWFSEVYQQMEAGITGQRSINRLHRAGVPNFYQVKHVACADRHVIKPYPVVENGEVFLALPKENQAWTKNAIRHSSLEWFEGEPSLTYFGSIKDVLRVAKDLKASGITVQNAASINRSFKKLRGLTVRT